MIPLFSTSERLAVNRSVLSEKLSFMMGILTTGCTEHKLQVTVRSIGQWIVSCDILIHSWVRL